MKTIFAAVVACAVTVFALPAAAHHSLTAEFVAGFDDHRERCDDEHRVDQPSHLYLLRCRR